MLIYMDDADIFASPAQTRVCPVNTVGTLGAGLAKDFRDNYPELLQAYRLALKQDVFTRKGFFVWSKTKNEKVLCMPTKRHWKNPSKLEWIDRALELIAREYESYDITSLAIPAVGCGYGMLQWDDVHLLIVRYLSNLDIDVYVYPP